LNGSTAEPAAVTSRIIKTRARRPASDLHSDPVIATETGSQSAILNLPGNTSTRLMLMPVRRCNKKDHHE